jgi:hypothetical protein
MVRGLTKTRIGSGTQQCRLQSFDLAILEPYDRIALLGNRLVVSHHDDGQSMFSIQLAQDLKNRLSGLVIQIACRFIGKEQRWVGYQSASYGRPLHFPAGEFPRPMLHAMA